jgi:hypothetical protein
MMVMIIRPQRLEKVEVVDTVEKDGLYLVPGTGGPIQVNDVPKLKPKWIKDLILSGTILTTSFLVTLAGMYWHLTLLEVFGISNAFTIGISLVYKRYF